MRLGVSAQKGWCLAQKGGSTETSGGGVCCHWGVSGNTMGTCAYCSRGPNCLPHHALLGIQIGPLMDFLQTPSVVEHKGAHSLNFVCGPVVTQFSSSFVSHGKILAIVVGLVPPPGGFAPSTPCDTGSTSDSITVGYRGSGKILRIRHSL